MPVISGTLGKMQEKLVAFACTACSVLWSEDNIEKGSKLPSSIKGKLGGPSLRRLTLSLTSSVLQAVILFLSFLILVRIYSDKD